MKTKIVYLLFFISLIHSLCLSQTADIGNLDDLCQSLIKYLLEDSPQINKEPVYVVINTYAQDGKSYPVAGYLRSSIDSILSRLNIKTEQSGAAFKSNITLNVTYNVTDERLFVKMAITSFTEHKPTTITSKSDYIERSYLPDYLFKRGMDEIVNETAYALSTAIPFSDVHFTAEQIKEKNTTNVSEFGNIFLNQLKNRLVKEYHWRNVTDTTKSSSLNGEYQIGPTYVTVTIQLTPQGITTTAQALQVDLGDYNLRPANPNILPAIEKISNASLAKDESFKVRIFTNKENEGNIYFPGEKLEITLIPLEDCYVRLYYLQANGSLVQLYPNSYSGQESVLRTGQTYKYPDITDHYELEITDETQGQETIIVYLCNQNIIDEDISKNVVEEAGIYTVNTDLRGLQRGLVRGITRGITVQKKKARYNILTKSIIIQKKEVK